MADIEFQEVVGQIDETVERAGQRRETEGAYADPDRLRRLIRDETALRARRAQRLEA